MTNQMKKKLRWTLAPAAVVLVLGLSAWAFNERRDSGPGSAVPTFTVTRGPLTISVTESGTIKSRQQEIIKNQVEGSTTILYIIPEGTTVKAGDLLVELDASRLNDQLVDQQIRVQNAEAAWVRSRENLEIVKNQAASDIARATLDYRFAEVDQRKYLEGEYPNKLQQAESKIKLTESEHQRQQEKLRWSKILFDEKYLSETERKADELAEQRAALDADSAKRELDLLRDYEHPRRVEELQSNLDQAEQALERVKRKAMADNIQAEADLRAKESEFNREKVKLVKIEEQLEKAVIRAPTDGLVIYATSAQSGRGGTEPLAEGQSVRERQDLIYLPTTTAVMVEIKVHESSMDKVRVGMPVRITVDALPGQSFVGRVTRIAPLPDAQSVWMNPDLKVYSTDIHVDGDGTGLRTGMSCRAEIVVQYYEDAMYVPVQAIVRVGDQPTAYVVNDRTIEARPVQIGLDNNRMVHIREGLKVGERVSLTPPLSTGVVPMETASPAGELLKSQGTPAAAPAGSPTQQAAPAPAAPSAGQGGEPNADQPRRGRGGNQFQNMTDEEREQRRRAFEAMTPEQREQMRQRMQSQRQNQETPQ